MDDQHMLEIRLRYCGTRGRFEVADDARAEAIKAMARSLTDAGCDADRAERMLTDAASAEPAELRAIERLVAELSGGESVAVTPAPAERSGPTFKTLAAQWTEGGLHKRYPDHVPQKVTADLDAQRFAKLCTAIGSVPIAAFTLADAERAMAALPVGLSPTTRRHYAGLSQRLLRLAVYPCRLINASPLPTGWLPKLRSIKAKAWLYPAEDAQLMACTAVPLARRVLWGVLAREGMRLGEAMALRWGDVDLERGAVRLDQNKTDDPRAWVLDPGVAAVLRWTKPAGVVPEARVFEPFDSTVAPRDFRAHLERAGVTRAELFEQSAQRMQIRVHDLRGTFVTINLANGRTETWIADRTGHRSSMMINRYRRAARQASELELGNLAPLNVAIPECNEAHLPPGSVGGPAPGPKDRGSGQFVASSAGFEPALQP